MSRLTEKERNFDGTAVSKENLIAFGMISDYCEKVLTKLADYEDKEEQGLLISVPCKIGDKAWVIDDDYEYPKKKKVYEAKWIRVSLVQTKLDNSFELRGEVSYQVYDCFYNDGRTMLHGMYVGQSTTKVGERVFLTRSEAEEALAKMGGKE